MWAPSKYSQYQCNSFKDFMFCDPWWTWSQPNLQSLACLTLPCPSPLPRCPTFRSLIHPVCSWCSPFTVLSNPTLRNSFKLEGHLTGYFNFPQGLEFRLVCTGLRRQGDIMSKGFDSVSGTLLLNLVLLLFNPTKPLLFSVKWEHRS